MPFTEVSKCMVEQKDENEDLENKEDFEVQEIKEEDYKTFKEQVEYCIDNEDFQDDKCLKLCTSKTLYEYKFPVNIFSAFRKSFRIIFQAFTEKSADDFYTNYNGATLKELV